MLSLWDLNIVLAVCFPLPNDYYALGLYIFVALTCSRDSCFMLSEILNGLRGLACENFFFVMLIVELIWTLLELLNEGVVLLLLP